MTAILFLVGLGIAVSGIVTGFRGDLQKTLAESPAMNAADRVKSRARASLLHAYAGLLIFLAGLAWLAGLVSFLINTFVR